MKWKILSILTILALVLSVNMVAAVPAGTVLAFRAPPAFEISAPSGATAVSGTVWAWGTKGATGLGTVQPADSVVPV